MSNKKGGGPAFPVVRMPVDPDTVMNHPGMELRDWFAANASERDIDTCRPWVSFPETWDEPTVRALARYVHADRMLKARETK